jgi:hypothetical protein
VAVEPGPRSFTTSLAGPILTRIAQARRAGLPPFGGERAIRVLIAHVRDPAMPPTRDRAGIPEDLERVVLEYLNKAPRERYRDAEDDDRLLRRPMIAV